MDCRICSAGFAPGAQVDARSPLGVRPRQRSRSHPSLRQGAVRPRAPRRRARAGAADNRVVRTPHRVRSHRGTRRRSRSATARSRRGGHAARARVSSSRWFRCGSLGTGTPRESREPFPTVNSADTARAGRGARTPGVWRDGSTETRSRSFCAGRHSTAKTPDRRLPRLRGAGQVGAPRICNSPGKHTARENARRRFHGMLSSRRAGRYTTTAFHPGETSSWVMTDHPGLPDGCRREESQGIAAAL